MSGSETHHLVTSLSDGFRLRLKPSYELNTFTELETKLRKAYGMRSRLTHGSLSPFHPAVEDYAPVCLQLVEEVISAELEPFESHDFMDRPRTQGELSDAFDALVDWAKAHSACRTPLGTAS